MYMYCVITFFRSVSALYWVGYESMKTRVLRTRGTTAMNFSESFMAGAVAGTIAGIITLPFDVIKTHRQIELGQVLQGN
ncbi:hypothetical protein KUTeg_015408 [Tegillarca granosa]|uniref:Uncharacterized protein n=1 Tax=Tegillarca granosa TaxID=220873 RepID=A0ABQ9EQ30_TEGGR|nr:hypothetical protein KUTeg_015408 [Tegillarca granosa]